MVLGKRDIWEEKKCVEWDLLKIRIGEILGSFSWLLFISIQTKDMFNSPIQCYQIKSS